MAESAVFARGFVHRRFEDRLAFEQADLTDRWACFRQKGLADAKLEEQRQRCCRDELAADLAAWKLAFFDQSDAPSRARKQQPGRRTCWPAAGDDRVKRLSHDARESNG